MDVLGAARVSWWRPSLRPPPVPVPGPPDVRGDLAALMDGTVKNEPNWHYLMARPLTFPTRQVALTGKVTSDCSFGCAILCKLAGRPLPTPQGNSWSMWEQLVKVSKADVMTGDMIVLGHEGRLHAMMVRKPGGDILCWSHGQERGPLFVPLSAEVSYHASRYSDGGVVTYLRLPA